MEPIKMSEVKNWDIKTIDAKVSELRKTLFNLRMQKVASGVEKPHFFKLGKKNIAQLLTVKQERQRREK